MAIERYRVDGRVVVMSNEDGHRRPRRPDGVLDLRSSWSVRLDGDLVGYVVDTSTGWEVRRLAVPPMHGTDRRPRTDRVLSRDDARRVDPTAWDWRAKRMRAFFAGRVPALVADGRMFREAEVPIRTARAEASAAANEVEEATNALTRARDAVAAQERRLADARAEREEAAFDLEALEGLARETTDNARSVALGRAIDRLRDRVHHRPDPSTAAGGGTHAGHVREERVREAEAWLARARAAKVEADRRMGEAVRDDTGAAPPDPGPGPERHQTVDRPSPPVAMGRTTS